MEEHKHAMQRAAELLDKVYNGSGGRLHVAAADAYIAMAREMRIGNYRMPARGAGSQAKYEGITVVIPRVEVDLQEPPGGDEFGEEHLDTVKPDGEPPGQFLETQ